MEPLLIVNPHSGDGGSGGLLAAAEERGVRVHLLADGDDPAELARTSGAPLVGVAGGDGSLAPVAAAAAAAGIPFVCVPFGTRNHFARDVGLDRDDAVTALDAFVDGFDREVDLGWANDRPFLNNVSLGAYARLVHHRERHRLRRNAFARVRALGILTAHRPERLHVDGEPADAHVLLVGNNAYRLDVLSIGERERLDEGLLHLYAAEGLLPWRWRERTGTSFRVDCPGAEVRAAVDGEPVLLETPLELRIDPRALRVRLPRRPGGK